MSLKIREKKIDKVRQQHESKSKLDFDSQTQKFENEKNNMQKEIEEKEKLINNLNQKLTKLQTDLQNENTTSD